MGVEFYLQDQRYWDDPYARNHYHLSLANDSFCLLRDVLELSSEADDYTGDIGAEALLVKIAQARITLQRQGKEEARSEETSPLPEDDQSLLLLRIPGLEERLSSYLKTLHRIALYAREVGTKVQWS